MNADDLKVLGRLASATYAGFTKQLAAELDAVEPADPPVEPPVEPPAPTPSPPPPNPPAQGPTAPAAGTVLAQQFTSFVLAAPTRVRYGAGTKWYAMDLPAGTHNATDPTPFEDPAYGVAKIAVSMGPATGAPPEYLTIGTPPPVEPPPNPPAPPGPPPPSPPPAPAPGALADPTTSEAAWLAFANAVGTPAAHRYLKGVPSTAPRATNRWSQRADIPFPSDDQRTYQFGAWKPDGDKDLDPAFKAGAFASDVAYVMLQGPSATRVGLAGILAYSQSNCVTTQKPEWWHVMRGVPGGGIDDPNLLKAKAEGADLSRPVAAASNNGWPGWGVQRPIVYASGFVGAGCTNTAANRASTMLPSFLRPTAIDVSSRSEMAAITCLNTNSGRAVVAFIALGGRADGSTATSPDSGLGTDGNGWWGEWSQHYPGLPNLGNFVSMKYLGFVELPASMRVPTGVSLSTGNARWAILPAGDSDHSPARLNLALESARARLRTGGDKDYGLPKGDNANCIVVSKSEQLVAVIDIGPLVRYWRKMYLGTQADFARTRAMGPSGNQWPCSFEIAPEQVPVVKSVRSLGKSPVSVLMCPWERPLAWFGTEDGWLICRDINAGTESSVFVGANVTSVRAPGEKAGSGPPSTRLYPDMTREVIVCSRGARAISWVRYDGGTLRIIRTLTDDRLVDPVVAEDGHNNGAELYILTVADYAGKKLHNYRFGPAVYWREAGEMGGCNPPNGLGMGPSGNDAFEYGGAFDLPAEPADLHKSNVS